MASFFLCEHSRDKLWYPTLKNDLIRPGYDLEHSSRLLSFITISLAGINENEVY